jgi:hypothetical protein
MAAYTMPAVGVWAVLGLLVNAIPLRLAAVAMIVVYSACYGLIEATGRARPAPPGSRWQVPQSMVRGGTSWRRMAVWGSILGPGFATRNPYAGFAVLPLSVAAVGSIRMGIAVAAAVGFAHGTGRALALLRDARAAQMADYAQSVLRSMYFRMADGYALLAISGVAAIMCVVMLESGRI